MGGNPFGGSSNPSSNPGSNSPSSTQKNTESSSSPTKMTRYSKIEKLKNKGNEYFRSNSYDEASSAYFEVRY